MTAVDALTRAGPDAYRRLVGGVFERSPWVAERAWERRPFATAAELHRATMDVVREASPEEKRFEFPFIICVRNHDKTGILDAFERRLRHPTATEIEVAIAEIAEITRYRLEALLGEPIPRA